MIAAVLDSLFVSEGYYECEENNAYFICTLYSNIVSICPKIVHSSIMFK